MDCNWLVSCCFFIAKLQLLQHYLPSNFLKHSETKKNWKLNRSYYILPYMAKWKKALKWCMYIAYNQKNSTQQYNSKQKCESTKKKTINSEYTEFHIEHKYHHHNHFSPVHEFEIYNNASAVLCTQCNCYHLRCLNNFLFVCSFVCSISNMDFRVLNIVWELNGNIWTRRTQQHPSETRTEKK